MRLLRDPSRELFGKGRKVEIEVFCLLEDRLRAVDLRTRVDELIRIELVAAVVALVPARARKSADRARAFDVAVGEGTAGGLLERSHRSLLDQVALVVELLEASRQAEPRVRAGGPVAEAARAPNRCKS